MPPDVGLLCGLGVADLRADLWLFYMLITTRARFEREVELAARLQHPNVARVFESGLHHGLYYYVMELIDGKNLEDYVGQHGLTHRQILELMRSVCRAVQHAHQMGVIHRDLKPSNILVAEDGQPYVLDFGLAKIFAERDSNLTVSVDGEIVGTLPYMSPEQAAGRHDQLDTRTDVYSLGLIMYRLLTGESPYDLSGTKYAVMRRIAEEEVRRPREIDKQIDKELEVLLLKALAHEPENRYATAGDLARDIDNYLNGDPLSAKPPTTLYFLRKRIRKYRTHIAVSSIVLVVVVGTAILMATLNERRKLKAIEQFQVQAAKLLEDSSYKEAEETFVKILALDQDNVEARKGISEAGIQQELKEAAKYLNESRFELALGLVLSAQQRFPDDARVKEMVRQVKGTAILSVKFDLGTVKKATLKKITMESDESERALPINELLSPGGVDIEPGWHWLTVSYYPKGASDYGDLTIERYLLFVRRSVPYELHVKKVLVGDVHDADFSTLAEAVPNCQAGHILSLAPGEHYLTSDRKISSSSAIWSIPNLTIESWDTHKPATLMVRDLCVCGTWDVKFSNLMVKGYRGSGGGAIRFENSVLCKLVDSILHSAAVDAQDCDGVELTSNHFVMYAHHRSSISNSRRVVLRNNIVHRVWEIRVVKGMPGEQAGLRTLDKVIRLDGNQLSPDANLPELIKNRKKTEPIVLQVERGLGDSASEIVIQLPPKQTQQKNDDYELGLKFTSIIGWRAFVFEDCQAVIAYGNEINRSGLTGIYLDHCSEALVACNTMCDNHEEGNIFLVNTDKAIIAFNDSHSASHYNIFLDYSVGLAIHHNQIRGGEKGIHLKGSNSSVRSNLITDSDVGIVFSGGMQNIVESNIFAHNKTLVRGQGGYWGVATFKANLMDKQVDYSNLGNIRLDMKNSNILCQFDTSMSLDGPSRLLVRSRDVNNVSDLQSHAYGPTVSLKPQYLAICNRIADMALEFGILDSDVSVNTEFNEILRSKTTRIIKEIKEMGLPTVNEKNLGLIPDQLVGARELNRNPMDIPRQTKSFGNHHYLLYLLEATTWKDAKKFCESVGGHLATITDSEEDKWIREIFPPSLGFWLGGTDEDEEDRWEWVTGEKWQYSPWNEGEPNNQGDGEHALHIWENGNWNDGNMQDKRYFLVEWDH